MTDKQYRWVPAPIGFGMTAMYEHGERWILQSKNEFTGLWETEGRIVKYGEYSVYCQNHRTCIGNNHNSMKEAAITLLESVKG